MSKKSYLARCGRCGAKYRLQGTEEELKKFLDIMPFECVPGRHIELGRIGDYLEVYAESDEVVEIQEPEDKKPNEYEAYELPKDLIHIGFGVFRDSQGNIYDYRIGPRGKRFYSIVRRE